MKIVCVDNIQKVFGCLVKLDLTIDRIYDVIDYADTTYIIIDDSGEEIPYSGFRFKKLEDVRDDKINKILE
jgi:hypothetical protein